MTIEVQLERIALALESIVGAAAQKIEVTPELEALRPETVETPEPKAAKPKAAKPKAAKPKAEEPQESYTIDDVRDSLKRLQKLTDAATAKAVLENFDVATLSALGEDLYGAVIALANEQAENATDEV